MGRCGVLAHFVGIGASFHHGGSKAGQGRPSKMQRSHGERQVVVASNVSENLVHAILIPERKEMMDAVCVRCNDAADDVQVLQPRQTFSTCATMPRKTFVCLIRPESHTQLLFPGCGNVSLESAGIRQVGLKNLAASPSPTWCFFALAVIQKLFGGALLRCPTIYSKALGKAASSLQGSLSAHATFQIALWSSWQWSIRPLDPKSGCYVNKCSALAPACVSMMRLCTGMRVGMAVDLGMGEGSVSRISRCTPMCVHTSQFANEICDSVVCLSRMSGDSHDSALQTTLASQLPCCVCSQLYSKCFTCLEIVHP